MIPLPTLWTPRTRQTLTAVLAVAMAVLWVANWRHSARVPDPIADGPRADELASTIDPNAADANAFAAIPGIGEARARAIVDYRARFQARNPGRPAFRTTRDFLPIKGIGVNIANSLAPYLAFPATRPAR